MWVWHDCLSSLDASCHPLSWTDLGELLGALVLIFAAILGFWIGLLLLGEWLNDLF